MFGVGLGEVLLLVAVAAFFWIVWRGRRAPGDTPASEGGAVKECPYCAETIKAKAIKCRYCHSPVGRP